MASARAGRTAGAVIVLGLILSGACSGASEGTPSASTGPTSSAGTGGKSAGQGGSGASSSSGGGSAPSGNGGGQVGGSGAGGKGGKGSGGAVGALCIDSDPGGEPNDSESTAYVLGAITCKDAEGGPIYGILKNPGDVDWYVYAGTDKVDCAVDPTQSIDPIKLRICAFFKCTNAATGKVACPAGTTPAVSPKGLEGCCGLGPSFTVGGLNCKGTLSEDITVYLRVDDPGANASCTEYTVTYHY